jgi:hypothetical protein
MSKVVLVIRYIVFCVFFAAGAGAIALSFLVGIEMTPYFRSCAGLDKTIKDNEKIQSLISQYQDQITLIEREPNVLSRLQDVAMGRVPEQRADVVYPSGYNPKLTAATRQVLDEAEPTDPNAGTPLWIQRCVRPKMRSALFMSGAGLILITFMLFGSSTKTKPRRKTWS